MPGTRDTTPEARSIQLDALRRMPPAARLRQALELSEAMRALALARLRLLHPGLSELELLERLLGVTLVPHSAELRPK